MFLKNYKLSYKLFAGFGIVTFIMLSVIGYSYHNFKQEGEAIELNIHSYQVISNSENILENLLNIETGARGYAITGKEEFLEPFYLGEINYEKYLNLIKKSTAENSYQQGKLMDLNDNYKGWSDWVLNNMIIKRQNINLGQDRIEDLISLVQQGTGKKHMDIMRSILSDIVKEEERILLVRAQELNEMQNWTRWIMAFGGLIAAFLAVVIANLISRLVVVPIKELTNTFMEISQGEADFEFRLAVKSNDELGNMAKYFNTFMNKIKVIYIDNRNQSWIKTGQTELNEKLGGEREVESIVNNGISFIVKYMEAQIGGIYVNNDKNCLKLLGSYAYSKSKEMYDDIKFGEGILGQSALEKQSIVVIEVPKDYVKISSGIGNGTPKNILVTPCMYNDEVKCVIEIGSFSKFTDLQLEFMERVAENIAVAIHSAESRTKLHELLEKALVQSEELQSQQEELRQSNEELEEQAQALKESEAQLQSQQEELKAINEELEEYTKTLEEQRSDITKKNENLKSAQIEIEDKVKDIETASKYKSEFLANMSHELRTPLNSILVLSQMLSVKKDNTPLSDKQLQFASTIHSSGQDLLRLINDILDLSKVEAGKMELNLEDVRLAELAQHVEHMFMPLAIKKELSLIIEINKDVPKSIVSDSLRIQQIVDNLLSNAFKFTHKGEVKFHISYQKNNAKLNAEEDSKNTICISVSDTGIGIPKEKQSVIFEAFKQSDGTTSRKYGGTGLGLSISKEFANILGGKICLDSKEDAGSTFSLIIPEMYDTKIADNKDLLDKKRNKIKDRDLASSKRDIIIEKETLEGDKLENHRLEYNIIKSTIVDDRDNINENDKFLLIIEDDTKFSNILCELSHEKGYKCLIAEYGSAGIELAHQFRPDAILLDIGIPDMSGWNVIEQLKKNKNTKDIPIHVISGGEASISKDKKDAIVSYVQKPASLEKLNKVFKDIEGVVSKPFKKLIVIDENPEQKHSILEMLDGKGIDVTFIGSAKDAFDILKAESFDCMILDLNLKDMTGLELLEKLKAEEIPKIPIIIHTEKIITQEEALELQKYTESIVIKGSKSLERLIAETNLFLHDIDTKIEAIKMKSIQSNHEKENSLANKKILVVDDDMRNVFALSNLLQEKGMRVVIGQNGREGIEKLIQNPDIDLVLMDIMMPIMDGYAAIRKIREGGIPSNIPIIALTAKAMKDDRQKCIEAGASDYLTKPIDVEKLFSLLRVWLYK